MAARTFCRADADGLVRETHAGILAVRLGIDGDSLNFQFPASADDADCDFPAVGNEDFLKPRQIGCRREILQLKAEGARSPRCR